MTQQLDLAFNTTKSMDNMMSSSSHYNFQDEKGYESEFTSFLNDANNSLNTNNKPATKDLNNKNNTNLKSSKSDIKQNGTNSRKENNEINSFKQENNTITTNVETNEISVIDTNNMKLNEIFEDQIFDTALSTSQDVLINEDFVNTNLIDINENLMNNELDTLNVNSLINENIALNPIQKAIDIENLVIDTDINLEDLSDVDIESVDLMAKDVIASKDEFISAMYNNAKDAKDVKVDNVKSEKVEMPQLEIKKDDVKIENVKTSDAKVEDVKIELPVNNVKTDDVEAKVELPQQNIVEDVKPEVAVAVEKAEAKEVKEVKNETVASLKLDTKVEAETLPKTDNKIEAKEEKENKVIDKTDITEKVVLEAKTETTQVVEPTNEVIAQSVQMATQKTVETKTTDEKVVTPKQEQLKEEISSAKLENSANMAQKTEKKDVAENNAKTNVNAEETMNIKDDVSDIEFINQKKSETNVDEKALNNNADKIKEKVENVKIKVEDNVKVVSQQNMTNENKVEKANETLQKAGLSTDKMEKMDAKIKDIDFSSNNNPQTDLGQTSQEMMMRDMLQTPSMTNGENTADLKVEFTNTLNKANQATNAQQTQAQTEAEDVDVLEQIRTRLQASNKGGLQKITIGLTPESLGKLNIEITKGQNGISAQILADNAQAKDILDKNLDSLKSVLQSQGVNVNNVNVRVAETGRSSDSNNNNMFQNEDNQSGSNQNSDNSRNSQDSDRKKHSEFEFIKNTVLQSENGDSPEQVISRVSQVEKTVSINGGLGKVNYKM